MSEFTLDAIGPLVERADVSGHSVQVTFRCPVSGRQIRGSANVVEDTTGRIGQAVKRSLGQNMRWSIARVVRSAMGYGIAGEIGSAVAHGAMAGAEQRQWEPGKAQVDQAILEAFKGVQSQFAWDGSGQRWVAASVFRELQTEFAVMLQAVVFDKPWDRNILARMLAEVADVDGRVDDQERELFHAFTGGAGPSLDELVAREPLTRAELQETSAEVRRAMLYLALAVALSDEEFASAERQKIAGFAAALGLSQSELQKGEQIAAEYIVDQALESAYADGRIDAAERRGVDDVAAHLGLDPERVQRLDARCRKRKGLL